MRVLKTHKKDFSNRTGCWLHFKWPARTVSVYGLDGAAASTYVCNVLSEVCDSRVLTSRRTARVRAEQKNIPHTNPRAVMQPAHNQKYVVCRAEYTMSCVVSGTVHGVQDAHPRTRLGRRQCDGLSPRNELPVLCSREQQEHGLCH